MIVKTFCSGPVETNCVLLGCSETGKAVIFDAPPESGKKLLKEIKKADLQVEKLLLTHSHWDHTGDLAFLKKELSVPVFVHELDAENVRSPGSDGLPNFLDIEPASVDGYLVDGQVLKVGNLSMEVIHTPGHTPGGVCFYLKEENLLISGDTLFQGSIGRIDLPTARPALMWTSLERLSHLPPKTRVIPGHGGETTIGAESWLGNAKQYFGG